MLIHLAVYLSCTLHLILKELCNILRENMQHSAHKKNLCSFPAKSVHATCISSLTLLPTFASTLDNVGAANDLLTTQIYLAQASTALRGNLAPSKPFFNYTFSALAGQTLIWSFKGPAVRVLVTYPDGNVDGPGIPAMLRLPQTGGYAFAIHSNPI